MANYAKFENRLPSSDAAFVPDMIEADACDHGRHK